MSERLHPVTNPQHRPAGLKNIIWDLRRAGRIHRRWPSREDKTFRVQSQRTLPRRIPGEQFTVNAGFSHPTGDQLRVLRSKIKDNDRVNAEKLMYYLQSPDHRVCRLLL